MGEALHTKCRNSRAPNADRPYGDWSLRGVTAGRKNWMCFGSDNGDRTATVLTILIATAKRLAIDPVAVPRLWDPG